MEMEIGFHHNVNLDSPESTVILEERIEELTSTTYSDVDDGDLELGHEIPIHETESALRVPFPELGLDLVDSNVYDVDSEHLDGDKTVRLLEVSSWEDNWLFQKKRKKDSDFSQLFAYNNLTLVDGPNLMLIPNPSQPAAPTIGSKDVDELSDLSERNSVGSLSFSEDEQDEKNKSLLDLENRDSAVSVGTTCTDSDGDKVVPKSIPSTGSEQRRKSNNSEKAICIKAVPKSVPVPTFVPFQQRETETVEDPSFVFPPGSASVQPGILIQFCCRVRGSSPLGVAWFKDDLRLTDDDDFRIITCGRDHILEIKRTTFELQGNFSCVVFNHINKKWCDFSLSVRTQPLRKVDKSLLKKTAVKNLERRNTPPKEHPPEVIQRTWAERIAEEQKGKQVVECSSESDVPPPPPPSPPNVDEITIPPTSSGTIAEREHKKWEQDAVCWPNNPYTKENLEKRAFRSSISLDSVEENNSAAETGEKDMSNPVIITPSKDLTRYQRDYYVPQGGKDEALNGFEEKVYSSAKYFPVRYKTQANNGENNTDEDQRSSVSAISVKDLVGKFSGDESQKNNKVRRRSTFSFNNTSNQKSTNGISCKLTHINVNHKVPFRLCTWYTRGSPSVCLCLSSAQACPLSHSMSSDTVPKDEKESISENVHSLTARNLTKEFREQTSKNLPRSTNTHPVMISHSKSLQEIDKCTEGNSSSSGTNATCSPTNEGYVSDESNSSCFNKSEPQVTAVKLKHPKRVSRSILERASFWEKRCEHGLLSDSSVNEEFPPM